MPTVSARGLARARGTVEDFVLSCFPVLGLPVTDALAFGDVLYFVEASLYEADEANEVGLASPGALGALEAFLAARGLLDAAVRAELDKGRAYWRLERDLVAAWRGGGPADLASAKRALLLKSFDYRLLALLTLRLVGRGDDAKVLAFFAASFALVELEDDLKDYHADIVKDAFNVYRAFVKAFAGNAPGRLLQ